MNHIAHCFLSFGDEDLLLGNFIGDEVKGNDWQEYPEAVQHGILLHRSIDSFTDDHPATRQSKERIRNFAKRYASPVTDILYDHLLAREWDHYASEPFDVFAERTYRQLEKRAGDMPEPLRSVLPRMLEGRFLHGYTHREGMEWVLGRFSKRLIGGMDSASLSAYFFEHIADFTADFNVFFPDLMAMSQRRIELAKGL